MVYLRIKVIFWVFSCLVINHIQINAQQFLRTESAAGLNQLRENNGVAAADFDNDGDLDLFVVAKIKDAPGEEKTHSALFRNDNNGRFTNITNQAGLSNLFPKEDYSAFNPALDGVKYGVSWGDYDNDGFPDLFFTHQLRVQLFHNNGNGTFTERTTQAGFTKFNNCWNTSATWFDFNKDGYLDIYIADWGKCDYNSFYLNNGNGTFTNVTTQFKSLEKNRKSYIGFPFDMNSDGWLDIYVTNDGKVPNELLVNVNGTSVLENAQQYGINNAGDDMGVGIGDYNNDGAFDFYVTNINKNVFYKNNGNNVFTDIAVEKNIYNTGWAWDNIFADFDLDGDEDLFIVNGFSITGPQKNRYFKNLLIEGQDGFLDVSDEVKLGEMTIGTSACAFDYDNDGDQDLFVSNNNRESFFYSNQEVETESNKWFKVSLQGTTSNRDAIGTTISVSTNLGTYHRYYTGIGFLSQSLQPVHFGLRNASIINEIVVKWPSGLVESYTNIEPNSYLKFIEGNGFEIKNVAPINFIFGCTDPNSCNYNPLATKDDGSCVYLATSQISGPNTSGYNNVETYSYNLSPGIQISWNVKGGEIIEGWETSTIKVKWDISNSGTVSAIISNGICVSSSFKLDVSLHLDNVSDKISVARIWNEAILEAIRNDLARPTVHARNLFHTAIALYDSWALYNSNVRTYLIGNTVNNFRSSLNEFIPLESSKESSEKAMSYAAYRLLTQRFKNSPGASESLARFNLIMNQLGYDPNYTSVNYESGDAAAMGNYIGQTIIEYGLSDGSNETNGYKNQFYYPVNPPLNLRIGGTQTGVLDPNRWQPLAFNTFVDQSGNIIPGSVPSFLSPEWGNVLPFALSAEDRLILQKGSDFYQVYHKPQTPPQLSLSSTNESSEQYKWNFSFVSIWSSHLDPTDGVLWDISPNNLGNIDFDLIPQSFSDYQGFYKRLDGGDISNGHSVNPATGKPYEAQIVPRGDYTRVLAEFWADGPQSETPPGHWFTILNYVKDHPKFVRKLGGEGDILDPLEWDVKAYFILGGAMHDAAITAWSIKGWYDFVRPISAIRYMCELGQSSDPQLPNYHVGGIQLEDGYIELVKDDDPLRGINNENVGKIKLYAWRGHDFIDDTKTDIAGVGWILAEDWWPYQRPTFVTPPFAGFISGHSTFSRAAAEVMTLLTGDPFFPGGLSEFLAKKNEFLKFEAGPSVDVKLQWATYRDASDQTSLSRIWGGIHPPADDLPGRIIGAKVGVDAYNFGVSYFNSDNFTRNPKEIIPFPNPTTNRELYVPNTLVTDVFKLVDVNGRIIFLEQAYNPISKVTTLKLPESSPSGVYILRINNLSRLLILNRE